MTCRCAHNYIKHYDKTKPVKITYDKTKPVKITDIDNSCNFCDCVKFGYWLSYKLTSLRRIRMSHLAMLRYVKNNG